MDIYFNLFLFIRNFWKWREVKFCWKKFKKNRSFQTKENTSVLSQLFTREEFLLKFFSYLLRSPVEIEENFLSGQAKAFSTFNFFGSNLWKAQELETALYD